MFLCLLFTLLLVVLSRYSIKEEIYTSRNHGFLQLCYLSAKKPADWSEDSAFIIELFMEI